MNRNQYQIGFQYPGMVNNNGDGASSSQTMTTAQLVDRELYNVAAEAKRKLESVNGENYIPSTCTCKNSRCIKLYCECFANNMYCGTSCKCRGCNNNLRYEDTVQMAHEHVEAEAKSKKKGGCSCKKSKCLKKYCECNEGNVGCSEKCQCFDCMNPNGTKDEAIQKKARERQDDALAN